MLLFCSELLLKLLQPNVKKGIPTIVFCNKADTAVFLHNFLTENNVKNIHFSAHMAEKVCTCEIKFSKQDHSVEWTRTNYASENLGLKSWVLCMVFLCVMQVRSGRFQQFQDGEVDILVGTDIASRGLDTVRVSIPIHFAEAGNANLVQLWLHSLNGQKEPAVHTTQHLLFNLQGISFWHIQSGRL